MSKEKAFLFDLNGTMIDDMDFHIKAWHGILNGLGANISLAQMKEECYGKNDELLERIFPGRFSADEKTKMSYDKETAYQLAFKPSLKLLDGLDDFMEKASKQNIPMAIGSAAIIYNIDFVLDNLNIRHYFKAIVSADDVVLSKPHPETFLKAAALLNTTPTDCLVFEDVPKGAEAAANAGMKAVVITTTHEPYEFEKLPNILHFAADFTDEYFNELLG